MGSIRKQTIISSLLVYVGFFIGAINTYFYTKNGSFTPEQYALTRIFFDFAQNMTAFGALGIIPVIYKFYPYYKDNLEKHRIDLMTWGMLASLIGFSLMVILGWYFRPVFVHQFTEKSKLIVDYYYWMFPFAMGMLLFSTLEGFSWALQKSILPNFLKETFFRIITSILILLFYFKLISFDTFVHVFTFFYLILFLTLAGYLIKSGELHFPFIISRVTKKFWKKMLGMQVLIYSGTLIASIAATIDSFISAKFQGLAVVGVFGLAQYAANLVQVPQRSIQAVSAGILSRAWKDKNLNEINRIYKRSCINLMLLALFIFGNLWLNVHQGMQVLNIQKEYEAGLGVIFILGMVRIIDAATGLNGMVIGTSTFWRFDFFSGVILLAFRLPITYYLIKHYGIIGSSFAELISYGAYNLIRYEFLRRKFNMQPFDLKTIWALATAVLAYFFTYYIFQQLNGWMGIIIRILSFSGIMALGIFYLQLTPDAMQLYHNLRKRWMK